MTLEGKVAVITGGTRGIGRAIAREFSARGCRVALLYAGNDQAAADATEELHQAGGECRAYRCDISDFAAAKETCRQIVKDFGSVDILVNNAGIVRDTLIASMKEEDFTRVLDVNLKGAFHMVKHLYLNFLKKRSGRIINITSVVGLMGNAGQANYAAAKAGLVGFTKSVAKELAGRGVTCNAIAPGFIETEMTGELTEEQRKAYLAAIPLKRLGDAKDVARAAAFLASDDAAYVTGEVLRVDGGLCM